MKKTRGLPILLSVLFLGFTLLNSATLHAEPGQDGPSWPRWRGVQGDGISMETNWDPQALAAGPKILWKAETGMGYSSVVIGGNCLYTMGSKDESVWLYCLGADSGSVIWRYAFPEKEFRDPQSTPLLDGDRVYGLGFEGTLVCLGAKDGKVLWERDLVSEAGAVRPYYGFAGSPVIEGDLLILEANTSGLALDRNTGETRWISDRPPKKSYQAGCSSGADYATPVLYEAGGKRYASVGSYKGLFAVEVETGKPLWTYNWEKQFEYAGDHITDPIIFDNKLFFVQFYAGYPGSALLDISGGEPKVLWENKDTYSETATPVLVNGYLYVCQGGGYTGRGALRCIDPAAGKMVWEEKLNKKPISLSAADGKLLILDESGALFIAEASPSGFKATWSGSIPTKSIGYWRTPPVLCGGRIYCRNYSGVLVCIDVSKS